MPVIDVFAGATELASAAIPGQPISGLPEREQYETWVSEQEAIEKEMEYFDKGTEHSQSMLHPMLMEYVSQEI